MPHIIVEHSSKIDQSLIKQIQKNIQKILVSIAEGNFHHDHCKMRSLSFGQYFQGDQSEADSLFIHVTIKILSGRSIEIRQQASKTTIDFLQEFAKTNQLNSISLSVDIEEMERLTYNKV